MDSKKLLNLLFWMAVISSIAVARPFADEIDDKDNSKDDDIVWQELKNPALALCDPCPGGWGVKSLCNRTHNTVCTPCPSGSWSPRRPHFRPCAPCSKCGDGLYEDIECTITRDTQCDSCSNVKGHLNEDYKRKCDWRHAPESLKMIGDRDDGEDREYEGGDDGGRWVATDNGEEETAAKSMFVEKTSGKLLTIKDLGDRLVELGYGRKKTTAIAGGDLEDDEVDDDDRSEKTKIQIESSEEDPKKASFWQDRLEELRRRAEQLSKSVIGGDGGEKKKEIASKTKPVESDESADSDDDDDDDEDLEDSQQQRSSPPPTPRGGGRPYVQRVMPIGGGGKLANPEYIEQLVKDFNVREIRPEVNYPPSYHQYPIESMMHHERRKAKLLIALTVLLVASAIVFVLFVYARYSKSKSMIAGKRAYDRVHVVNLSPEEQEIVRRSATQLSRVDDGGDQSKKSIKKWQLSHQNGYTTLVDAEDAVIAQSQRSSSGSLAVRENPLEAYLNGDDLAKTHKV